MPLSAVLSRLRFRQPLKHPSFLSFLALLRADVGLATPDHTPAGRGWDESEIYFDGANDVSARVRRARTCGLCHAAGALSLTASLACAPSASQYWTSISGGCSSNASDLSADKGPVPITDLWLTGNGTLPAGGAPAYGQNNCKSPAADPHAAHAHTTCASTAPLFLP